MKQLVKNFTVNSTQARDHCNISIDKLSMNLQWFSNNFRVVYLFYILLQGANSLFKMREY